MRIMMELVTWTRSMGKSYIAICLANRSLDRDLATNAQTDIMGVGVLQCIHLAMFKIHVTSPPPAHSIQKLTQ